MAVLEQLYAQWVLRRRIPLRKTLSIRPFANNDLLSNDTQTGGSSDPSDLVRLIFERVIFDHNSAFVR